MPRRKEDPAELHAKIASLENLRPELGDEFVNQKIEELRARVQSIQSSVGGKKRAQSGQSVGRDQSLQSGDASVAVQGNVNDSTIVHAQTVVLAERFWRGLNSCPARAGLETCHCLLSHLPGGSSQLPEPERHGSVGPRPIAAGIAGCVRST